MKIADLIPTHNRLRRPDRLSSLSEELNLFPPTLSLLEDGEIYIHDGHHRLVWMYLNGIKEITQYSIREFRYSEYNSISWENQYFTPFYLESECRTPDFYYFKQVVLSKADHLDRIELDAFIKRNHRYYVEPRRIYSLKELAESSKDFI